MKPVELVLNGSARLFRFFSSTAENNSFSTSKAAGSQRVQPHEHTITFFIHCCVNALQSKETLGRKSKLSKWLKIPSSKM
jgi:hypothetical protein